MLMSNRKKLFISAVSLTIAVIMLAVASFAWFTISTNPEIANVKFTVHAPYVLLLSKDGENFYETIDISDMFEDFVGLRPVSTIDGVHWFIPTYDPSTGELNDPENFIMDSKLEYANAITPTAQTGAEAFNADNKGYYVYTDIWIKTEVEQGCDVRLSIPHAVDEDELEHRYGTYVLSQYSVEDGVEAFLGRNSEAAIRIGFLPVLDKDDDDSGGSGGQKGEETTSVETTSASPVLEPDPNYQFIIFEPNADKRSAINKPSEAGAYVKDYTYDADTFKKGTYNVTRPIGYLTGEGETIKVRYFGYIPGEDLSENFFLKGLDDDGNEKYFEVEVMEPEEEEEDEEGSADPVDGGGEDPVDGGGEDPVDPPVIYCVTVAEDDQREIVYDTRTDTFMYIGQTGLVLYKEVKQTVSELEIPADQLIVQKASTWKTLGLKSKFVEGDPLSLDSRDIETFGRFVDTTALYSALGDDKACDLGSVATDIAGNALVLTLPDTTPVHIRLFVWVEGQDVDCWNDIVLGQFRVNIELAGVELPAPTEE